MHQYKLLSLLPDCQDSRSSVCFLKNLSSDRNLLSFIHASWSIWALPPRGLSGAPLWRIRGPVGLPLSSNRPFFPGGGRPLRSGLPPLCSGLSWVMGLSPPRSILLQAPRGSPARENESAKKKFYSMISRISKIRHWYLYFSDGQNEEFVLLQVCVYTSQSLMYHVSLCHRNPLSCCCKHTLLH